MLFIVCFCFQFNQFYFTNKPGILIHLSPTIQGSFIANSRIHLCNKSMANKRF